MIFILFLVSSCAFFFSPVQAALQASVRERSRADQVRTDTKGDQASDIATEIPKHPTCSAHSESFSNTSQPLIELDVCRSKAGTSPVSQPTSQATRQPNNQDFATELSSGRDQLDSGVYVAAAIHYTHARDIAKGLGHKPFLAEASQKLAMVWLLQGKLTDALGELLTTVTLIKTAPLLHVLGNVHRELGHVSKALELYEETKDLERNPNPQVLIDMGEAHARLGSFDAASQHVEEALRHSKRESLDAARAHSLAGFIRLSSGDASGSLQSLDTALNIQINALRPGHHDLILTQIRRSLAFRDTGSLETALATIESLEQTLRNLTSEELQLSRVLAQKADFLHQRDRLTDAKKAIDEVFALQTNIFQHQAVPEVASAMRIYASILHDTGNIPDARSHYKLALDMNQETVGRWHPETAAVHNSLGTLFQDTGNLAKAAYHYEACLKIQHKTIGEANPEVASTYNNMATVAFQQGSLDEAQTYLERSLSLLDAAHVPEESPDRVAYSANLSDLKKLRAE